MMAGVDFIQDLAVVMLVAGVVGWICHRAGLSVVVGYLAAGILIGPHTPPFSLVFDIGRIQILAQVGLVFLMFSIGMRLSFRRLRNLGFPLIVATFTGAVLMFNLVKAGALFLDWPPSQGLFLGAMLIVSSSAIIAKVLQETGATHEKSGQLAMGVTVLEDVVAVVMLTFLNSFVQFGGGAPAPLGETLGTLGAFVSLSAVAGLLFVPWLLRRLSATAGPELQTIVMAGLVFTLALVATRAGYSLALGAFLLGAIVAETPQRAQIDRAFEGLRDLFSAVFFVAIGMLIEVHLLKDVWWLVLAVSLLTLVGRLFSISVGMVLIGTAPRDAYRVGLSVTPIGEFSFIIAQMGVLAGVVPRAFYPLAVGVSLLTTLVAPTLMRHSAGLAGWMERRQPRLVTSAVAAYHRWLERLQQRERRSVLWQLSKKRLVQITVEVLLVTGLLVFSQPLYDLVAGYIGERWLFGSGARSFFWVLLGLILLVPLVAIWRNISALALLYAEVSTAGTPKEAIMRPLVETAIKGLAGAALFVWLWGLFPFGRSIWVLVGTLLVAAALLAVLWRKLIFWHSRLEGELQELLIPKGSALAGTAPPWLRGHRDWNLSVGECIIPDLCGCGGKSLRDLRIRSEIGCTVVGIERQGYTIANPAPDTAIYPRDKLLLMGTPQQIAAARRWLTRVSDAAPSSDFDEVRMETINVEGESRLAGRTLRELGVSHTWGILVAGIKRGERQVLNPDGRELLREGDELLILGTPAQIKEFRNELRADGKGTDPAAAPRRV